MKNLFRRLGLPFFLFCCLVSKSSAQVIDSTTILFDIDTVAKYLSYPWEITHGPDDSLWITEARGYRVLRISASRTGLQKEVAAQQILAIPFGGSEVNFGRSQEAAGRWPQGGMQGLAIHPEFLSGKPWVYLSYVFKLGVCPAGSNPCYYRAKIVRCRFYFAGDPGNPTSSPQRDTLIIMDTVISNLPGSNDHNSGRLTISPVTESDGTYKLYYTIGDMGAGQFNNAARAMHAQNRDTCEGKILRLNTEPDGDASFGVTHDYNTWREWIPNDNPFNHSSPAFSSLKTPVFSYGHRNAQGIVWGNPNGVWRLYSSEHGDKSDDELNIITAGQNYGWPKVAGLCDDNYNTYDAYVNNNQLAGQNVSSEIAAFCNITSDNNAAMYSFFNWPGSSIPSSGSHIFTWPTIAPSSIDFYGGTQIPGWRNSLLVTSLKYGLYRMKLNATGIAIDSNSSLNNVDTFPLLHGWRVRDIAIHRFNGGGQLWVVIDSTGSTSGPTGGFGGSSTSTATKDGGKVLRLTYKNMSTLPVTNNPRSGPPESPGMVRIFPNPVQHTLYVQGTRELRKPLLARIFDINGKMLKEEKSFRNEFAIQVADLKPGVYILKLYNGNEMEVQTEKFIRQ